MPKLIRNISNDKNKKTRKKYLSKFNDQWLKIPTFKTWLNPLIGDNTQASWHAVHFVRIVSLFSIESGGVGALESRQKLIFT